MKTYMRDEFAMDRRIEELEDAITANDEHLQKVEALNAELLAALKLIPGYSYCLPQIVIEQVTAAIAKAEGR